MGGVSHTSMHAIPPHNLGINLHSRASDHVLVAFGICMARAVIQGDLIAARIASSALIHHTRQTMSLFFRLTGPGRDSTLADASAMILLNRAVVYID